jgi:L-threonylcarbamoyladenylate synthase
MPDEPAAHAAILYSVLHAVDKRSLDAIIVDEPPAGDAWRAIHDRLARAAAAVEPDAADDVGTAS